MSEGKQSVFWSFGPWDADPDDQKGFWKQVQDQEELDGFDRNALRDAIGCYLFVMKRGEKLVPWYVGKTNAKTGFYREVFTRHKCDHFSIAKQAKPGWKSQMMLFPLITGSGRFSKAYTADKPVIEWMERTLIGMALAKNSELYNKRDTLKLKTCILDGVFGDGKYVDYPAAVAARRALTDYADAG